jgi:gas vesicle protein
MLKLYFIIETTNYMTTGKALLGVLAGIAAGAVLGVLFAPAKGVDTRKNIVRKSEDLAHELNDKIDQKFNELTNSITGNFKKTKSPAEAVKTPSEMIS